MSQHYQLEGRDYQILFLSLFLLCGIYGRDWSLAPWHVFTVLPSCLITQWLWAQGQPFNWKSPTITALSLTLLLRSHQWWVLVLASVLAISSKFIFRYEGKHWFNPANFGIVLTLLLPNDAWVSPGQWGNDLWLCLLFLGLGGIVLRQVGRWDTSCLFLLSYGSLLLLRNMYLGWSFDVFLHQMMSGSLLLFALFMITDPRSIPDSSGMRMLWASLIAVVAFILQFVGQQTDGIFYALFLVSPLTICLDRLQSAPRFQWHQSAVLV
ncbi:MAG: RnfABCDGE type electron transport complex subunit D [Pseudanabaenaceae cyanobacterium SKYGB_i_bin29]|nr:RnfABCDGE type electron transport complex subunit D [Pseudanabaenaceae cyanobacterium SKYG29]MDW8421710.1 RnfABCDGE type electron transport complex subunit D [Pseudanabaenaceae cyanobacterium SKYGB_i_bin29]